MLIIELNSGAEISEIEHPQATYYEDQVPAES